MNNLLPLPPLTILSAGKSERMGTPKGLVNLGSELLLEFQIKNYSSIGDEKIIVVLGSHFNEYKVTIPWIEKAIKDYHKLESNSVKVVINNDFNKGQFSSLQVGLTEFLKTDSLHTFILPIDVPLPSEDVLYRMLTILNKSTKAIIPELFGKGGHPVLISREFAEHLITLDPTHKDSRLDRQIKMLDSTVSIRIGVGDPGIHLNINTPERVARFIKDQQSEE